MAPLFIAGAGLSGLIAARMLINRSPKVFEAQAEVPNNHAALLRFRSDAVAVATNTPFTRVRVLKGVVDSLGAVQDALNYSLKVTGKLHARSILDLEPVDRWVAPDDFISRLASSASIQLGRSLEDHLGSTEAYAGTRLHPIISTLPMPVLMDVIDWKGPRPEFRRKAGWTIRAKFLPEVDSRVSATLYAPHRRPPWYRASITGENLIVEGIGAPVYEETKVLRGVMRCFELPFSLLDEDSFVMKDSAYQKIEELRGADQEHARRFIMAMTEQHGIYSLGRFATWRPKVLLDDIANDVRAIERLLDGDSGYSMRL